MATISLDVVIDRLLEVAVVVLGIVALGLLFAVIIWTRAWGPFLRPRGRQPHSREDTEPAAVPPSAQSAEWRAAKGWRSDLERSRS